MRFQFVIGFVVVSTIDVAFARTAPAAQVLYFPDRNVSSDTIEAAFRSSGHSVTIGPRAYQFEGSVGPFPLEPEFFDVVVLSPWQIGASREERDMPAEGQEQIKQFVERGGGLITREWTVWTIGDGQFDALEEILPVEATSFNRSPEMVNYSRLVNDPVLAREIPSSFDFRNYCCGYATRHETALRPKGGATAYYDSDWIGNGVVGWDLPDGEGRVLSISAVVDERLLEDADFTQLLSNAVIWAANLDGDYVGDGRVAQADLDLVLLNWGNPAAPPPEGWIHDLPSGRIDQDELDRVLLNWGSAVGAASTAAVPEPGTITLAALAAALFVSVAILQRRRVATQMSEMQHSRQR